MTHTTRTRITCLLDDGQPRTASQIHALLPDLRQTIVSATLHRMVDAGVLSKSGEHRNVMYRAYRAAYTEPVAVVDAFPLAAAWRVAGEAAEVRDDA